MGNQGASIYAELGDIIVAGINVKRVKELLNPDLVELKKLIAKQDKAKRTPTKKSATNKRKYA